MLFQGTLHKGIFIKEMFVGSFTEYKMNNEKSQILCLSEKRVDLYEYSYDSNIKMSFLEPILTQDLFIHNYNGKIITEKDGELEKDILILLTSCGLILFSFNNNEKLFIPVASCVLNMNCEIKDKFMYLKSDSE